MVGAQLSAVIDKSLTVAVMSMAKGHEIDWFYHRISRDKRTLDIAAMVSPPPFSAGIKNMQNPHAEYRGEASDLGSRNQMYRSPLRRAEEKARLAEYPSE